MKDKFGHLKEESEGETEEKELRSNEPRPDDKRSEHFKEAQEKVLDNLSESVETDRERELRRDTDLEENGVVASVTDVDRAITYELDENFDFHVQQNNKRIKVPVIWDNQERWTWARQRRNLKSVKDKVLFPLIVVDRTDFKEHPTIKTKPTITELDTLGRTMTVRQRYSKKNRYDQFTTLQNAQPEKEYYITQVPFFFQASYDVTVFTEYRWQMDPINDLIQYYDSTYWGNDGEGKVYYTQVESINTTVEMTEEARYVQSEISLLSDGYIVPDDQRDDIEPITKQSSPSKLKFTEEIIEDPDEI